MCDTLQTKFRKLLPISFWNFPMDRLQKYTNEIVRLCQMHKVKSLYAFGSVLTENFNSESDIDLIVDFEKIDIEDYADNYFDFKFSLQDILDRPVDLLEAKAIRNPYLLDSLNKQRKLVYGKWSQSMVTWYLNSIEEINSYFENHSKDFSRYQKDLKTKRAVERNIEIIGEAMSRILKRDQAINISSSRKLVDTRNRIIHAYDAVSDEIIWSIVVRHLPILKNEIDEILNGK